MSILQRRHVFLHITSHPVNEFDLPCLHGLVVMDRSELGQQDAHDVDWKDEVYLKYID